LVEFDSKIPIAFQAQLLTLRAIGSMAHDPQFDDIGTKENVRQRDLTITDDAHQISKARTFSAKWDHTFFGGMALVLTGSTFLGFAHTYYLAGLFRAKLPTAIIHIHGVIFSLWFILLVLQTLFVSVGRVGWHRRLGAASYAVAALVVIFGIWAAADALRRGVAIGNYDLSVSFAVSFMDMVAFSTVMLCSYLARSRPDAHKRLVLVATLSIMDAAFDRWPYEKVGLSFSAHSWVFLGSLLLPVAYDLLSLRRVHMSTLWSASLVYTLNQVRIAIGETHLWHVLCQLIKDY
jgi:hypothetical protein